MSAEPSQACRPGFTPVCSFSRLHNRQGFSAKCNGVQSVTSGDMPSHVNFMHNRARSRSPAGGRLFRTFQVGYMRLAKYCFRTVTSSHPRSLGSRATWTHTRILGGSSIDQLTLYNQASSFFAQGISHILTAHTSYTKHQKTWARYQSPRGLSVPAIYIPAVAHISNFGGGDLNRQTSRKADILGRRP
ncbi:hypothetical protein CC86DRAFT_54717 [Ophiobolus disseminans]|uniref:Uncharacterized protein n=1 Tax=Ophiobolus disseminans TaxID=1469910 RepID=A0A6A6ZUE4_9PLEO|nr:hypothetical protein CC86DRAFT_54717 [Ophiobolus disseminans]